MPNQDSTDLTLNKAHAHAFGDLVCLTKKISLSAATVADVFRFMRLPANCQLVDAILKVTDASNATVTLTLGYQHVGGEAGDDTSHFLGATTLAALGITRADQGNEAPVLAYESDIVGVLAGANITQATIVEVTVFYRYLGGL